MYAKVRSKKVSDPRVFFAAERTLLAWVRTGLTIMALGFVVARFGLFLSLLRNSIEAPGEHTSWPSGVSWNSSCAYRLCSNLGCSTKSPALYLFAPVQ